MCVRWLLWNVCAANKNKSIFEKYLNSLMCIKCMWMTVNYINHEHVNSKWLTTNGFCNWTQWNNWSSDWISWLDDRVCVWFTHTRKSYSVKWFTNFHQIDNEWAKCWSIHNACAHTYTYATHKSDESPLFRAINFSNKETVENIIQNLVSL